MIIAGIKIRKIAFSTLLLVGTVALIACKKKENPDKEDLPEIIINTSDIISSNFIGNGVQWSAYPEFSNLMTEEKWQTVFSRLDYMKPQLIRVMISAGWRYRTGEFERNLEPLLKLLGYCQDNDIEVAFGEWGSYNADILDGDFSDDDAWLDLASDYLEFLVKDKGLSCIKSYILINEPNGYWSSTEGNWGVWKRLVQGFQTRLVSKGLSNSIKISGPDAAFFNNSSGAKTWVTNTVNELDDLIGTYNIHAYIGQEYVRSDSYSDFFTKVAEITESTNKPFIMGELGYKYYDDNELNDENIARAEADGYTAVEDCNMFVYDFSYGIDMADVCIQSMNIGFDGMVAWDLDDAMHSLPPRVEGRDQLKRWGFWNILGGESKFGSRPEDEEIRPWFYTWSLLCRFFPKGSELIRSVEFDKKGLNYIIARHDGEYSIAIVNSFFREYKFELKFESSEVKTFDKYIYTEAERPVDENNFPVPVEILENIDMEDGLVINSLPQSVMVFTSMKID